MSRARWIHLRWIGECKALSKALFVCRKPIKEFLDAIQALQPGDINKLVAKLLSSPVTHASYGDIANLPRYDELQKVFK